MGLCAVGVVFLVLLALVVGFWSSISNWLSPSAVSTWLASNATAMVGVAAIATAVAALIGTVGLIFAAVGAFGVRKQVLLQRKIAYEQSARECLWRFTDQWRSDLAKKGTDGESSYTRARGVLTSVSWKRDVGFPELIGASNDDVIDVLNFFDGIAYMRRRQDMDQELAWNAFYSDAVEIYELSSDFRDAYRRGTISRREKPIEKPPIAEDMTIWEDLDWWAADLAECEARKQMENAFRRASES